MIYRAVFFLVVALSSHWASAADSAPGNMSRIARRVPAASQKPNVILVLVDDQGYGDLSCHGNPVLKTPQLDRLHNEGVRLTDFHVAPMCTPTRGELMTGRDALANGAMNVSSGRAMLRRGIPTMADIFAANGYRTGQFGKWHLGDDYPFRPQDRGFQETLFFPSSYISAAADHWNNDYFNPFFKQNGVLRQFQGYCTDVLFAETKAWVKGCRQRHEPFFVYLPLNAVHAPLFVPDKYREPYRHLPRYLASFFGMIANIDENMGKLDEFLAAEGLRGNTILIFMTDNGGTFGVPIFNAGMRGQKIDLYDGGHRVPCFVRWPSGKLRPPGDVDELTECQDLLPTLIELCGLKPPRGIRFDGVSLAGLLRGEQERLPDRMLTVQFSRMGAPRPKKNDCAVLWRRWRLVQGKELYDLRTDPGQKQNIAAAQHPLQGEPAAVVARMQSHYDQWWARVAPGVDQFSRITLGADAETPTMLSPADWEDVFLDQQLQVRRGEGKNGHWNVVVDRAGEYEVSLRRWPVEADAALTADLPVFKAVDGIYPPGKALPIAKARLRVADIDRSRTVGKEDKAATFQVTLPAGATKLQTWFYDAAGKELCGAYYVYVRRK